MSVNTESIETISLRVAIIQKCMEDCLEIKDQQIFHLEQRIKEMEKIIQHIQVLPFFNCTHNNIFSLYCYIDLNS